MACGNERRNDESGEKELKLRAKCERVSIGGIAGFAKANGEKSIFWKAVVVPFCPILLHQSPYDPILNLSLFVFESFDPMGSIFHGTLCAFRYYDCGVPHINILLYYYHRSTFFFKLQWSFYVGGGRHKHKNKGLL